MVLGLSLGVSGLAGAQEPGPRAASQLDLPPFHGSVLAQQQPGKDKKPDDKEKKEDKKTTPPLVDFTALPPSRAEAPVGLNPNMIGDFSGLSGLKTILVPATATFFVPAPRLPSPGPPAAINNPPPGQTPPGPNQPRTITVYVPVDVHVPIAVRGAFKIGENESPRPQDRIFFTYNFYDNTRGPSNGSEFARTLSTTIDVDGIPTPATLAIPGFHTPRLDLHRETIGFEKTFLDGVGSIGVRVPFFQQTGDPAFSQQDLGDISVIFKIAPWMDAETGNLVSTGLMITTPTGPDIPTTAGNIHPTLLQPFVGYFFHADNLFLQGFTSLVVPTDSRDVTLLFNDIGVGYWLYQAQGGLLTSVAPTLEAHLTTPLNHHNARDPISGADILTLTGGVHLGLGPRSTLTLGLATPITGPRPFDVEAVVQFNWRF